MNWLRCFPGHLFLSGQHARLVAGQTWRLVDEFPYPSFSPAIQQPRRHRVLCADSRALHRMHYTEWGDPDNPRVLVCVHGLTRNGRDFDTLALALSNRYRVVCPDVVGRGRSDWLTDPAGYGFPSTWPT